MVRRDSSSIRSTSRGQQTRPDLTILPFVARYLTKSNIPVQLSPATADAIRAIRSGVAGCGGTAIFAHAMPNSDAAFDQTALAISIGAGQTLQDWRSSSGASWDPALLVEGGFMLVDDDGNSALDSSGVARRALTARWEPEVPLPRLDDDDQNLSRRLASEVAMIAMLRRQMNHFRLPWRLVRCTSGGTRGAAFKHGVAQFIADRLGPDWEVRTELPLDRIYGLHMRRDVGKRGSDVAVLGPLAPPVKRLFAVISCKASWRSDRGTEAAQMVPLRRYRPDVPYAMVTAEFPRVTNLSSESVEDRIYHPVPKLWAAWAAYKEAWTSGSPVQSLARLEVEAERTLSALQLDDLDTLISDLAEITIA